MAVRVVGAGLGRTGTNSFKLALERLFDGRCYHMYELIERPQDTERWESAVAGEPVDQLWTFKVSVVGSGHFVAPINEAAAKEPYRYDGVAIVTATETSQDLTTGAVVTSTSKRWREEFHVRDVQYQGGLGKFRLNVSRRPTSRSSARSPGAG